MRQRTRSLAPLLVVLLCVGCASVPAAPKQALVAHYAADVMAVVTQQQTLVTEAAGAGLPVATARQLTDANQKIVDAATQLASALRTYDSAATIDVRHLSVQSVESALVLLNQALSQAFHVEIPSGVTSQILALYTNIAKLVTDLQAEIAKGWQ
jgi:membrane-bound lytic murein transglycosylase B